MDHISSLFEKIKSKISSGRSSKIAVQKVLKEQFSYEVPLDNISVKNNIVVIKKIAPLIRSEILFKKDFLLKKLSEEGQNFKDIR